MCYYFGTRLVLLISGYHKYQNAKTMTMAEKIKEPVRLRQKTLTNGNVSLYLAINTGAGRREYEFLRLYLIPEKTKADKVHNRETLALANSIKAQRIVDIQKSAHGFKSDYKEQTLFFDYYQALTEKRKKKESYIRKETKQDYKQIHNLVLSAFLLPNIQMAMKTILLTDLEVLPNTFRSYR